MKPNKLNTDISWQQVEYIKHPKTLQWYMIFTVVTALSLIAVLLITASWSSMLVILLAAISGLIYSNKDPEIVDYTMDVDNFSVNSKMHRFDEYKAFSPIIENGIKGAVFTPVSRAKLHTYIYFTEETASDIFQLLQSSLVTEKYRPDLSQRVIDSIRF